MRRGRKCGGPKLAIYLTSIIKPSFYYPCVAVGKFWQSVAVFLAGRDCQILQIETQKRNAFTLSFLSRRDLQILLVEPAKESKTAKFCRPTHTGNNRLILLTRTIQSFMRIGWFCSLFVGKKWRSQVLNILIKLELEFFLIYNL